MTKDTTPVTIDESGRPVSEIDPDPDKWWGSPEADEVEGYDLVKDAALFSLVGVPFMITRLVWREGIQRKGSPWRDDYVSAELRVAPELILRSDMPRIVGRRGGKLIGDKYAIAKAGECLVINDGSTGFYRQILQYAEAKGLVTIGDAFPTTGEKGSCRYDLPRSEWESGEEAATLGFDVALRCVRGLRYSDYVNQYTDDNGAITWYIA